MSPQEIAEKFPEAVAFARRMRDTFGPGVRLLYARNAKGEQLGKQSDTVSEATVFRNLDRLGR